MTPDHDTIHRICDACMEGRGLKVPLPLSLILEPGEGEIPRAERCCFCAFYTRLDLTIECPADEVPHNQRAEEWMTMAHMTPDQMTDITDPREIEGETDGERAMADEESDPREVTPQ